MSGDAKDKLNPLLGRWRIERTDLWQSDDVDLLGPAFISFTEDGLGSLRVGALEADLDHRTSGGRRGWKGEFTWSGLDDGTPVSGRGWVRLVDADEIKGKLFVHLGEEARLVARRGAGS